jgi:hypothetical protein
MDLHAEIERLRLDQLALAISEQLRCEGVPHVLLKGPSTANWLYDPPRRYGDVDILVPLSRVGDAVRGLDSAGLARASGGAVGEEAQHSLRMQSTLGYEVDVHVSLPCMPPDGDRIWQALAPHVKPLELSGVGTVPALDEPARCLVIALHAVVGGGSSAQGMEDLRRAREVAGAETWRAAADLAERLQITDLFETGLGLVDGAAPRSARAYLLVTDAPSAAVAWQRLADTPLRDLPRMLLRELVPTRGFMINSYPGFPSGRFGLLRAHLHRWRLIARQLPAARRALREARRETR